MPVRETLLLIEYSALKEQGAMMSIAPCFFSVNRHRVSRRNRDKKFRKQIDCFGIQRFNVQLVSIFLMVTDDLWTTISTSFCLVHDGLNMK